jgi:hypothetical protein
VKPAAASIAALWVLFAPSARAADSEDSDDSPPESFAIGLVAGDRVGPSAYARLFGPLGAQLELGIGTGSEQSLLGSVDLLYRLEGTMPSIPGRGPLVPWFGVGVRIARAHGDASFGLRAPIGLSFFELSPPIELLLEVAPAMDLATIQRLSLEGGFAVRVRL